VAALQDLKPSRARHVSESVARVLRVVIPRFVLVRLARFKPFLQGRALRMQIIHGCILALQGVLQLSDQPLFQVVQLIEFELVHRLFLEMLAPNHLVSPLNGLKVRVLIVLLLKLGLFLNLIHGGCVLLLVVQISVLQL